MASATPIVVLVTGVSRYLGARLASRLSDDAAIERIIGVDAVPPGQFPIGRAEFVGADLAHPLIARVLDQADVDTVVHTGRAPGNPDAALAGETMALLDACRRAPSVARVVALSSTDVYGATRHDPAVFTELMQPARDLPAGPARAAAELEVQVRAFARRRPDIAVTTPRLAPMVGEGVDSWFTRYLSRPWAPTALGFDPTLQLVHEYDAVEAVCSLARSQVRGPVNVAGADVVTVNQALRIAGKLRVPLPTVPIAPIGLRAAALLRFGNVVDTTRLTEEVGYRPRYGTLEALHAYLGGRRGLGGPIGLASAALARTQRLVAPATAALSGVRGGLG